MNVVEVSGSNVEEAIKTGLQQLGVGRAEADIEILDEGSSGFLGLGSRDAVVRISVKGAGEALLEETEGVIAAEAVDVELETAAETVAEEIEETVEAIPVDDEESAVALEIVQTLLDKMFVDGTTTTRLTEPDERTGEQRLVIDIHGDDMGILIGPRGETLNSFQFIARLMAGHATQKRPGFIVDVEGYRERREMALARLAQRNADKAVSRGKPITLEPMPPNERRIIHITLRDNDLVYTESSGEGPRRRVRIYPK